MSSMLVLFMLIAGGVGYMISARKDGVVLTGKDTSIVEAELLENHSEESL